MTVFQLIKSDYNRYKTYGSGFFATVFLTQGFWASFQYRWANYCFRKVKIQPFRALFKLLLLFWQKQIEIITGISIPASAQIGHSLYIGHFGNIIFNAGTVMGNNCNISQGVTIGISGSNERKGVPVIGNAVFLGAYATIVGKIAVGDGAMVCANTFVNVDVEAGTTVLGVPSVVISQKGSKAYI